MRTIGVVTVSRSDYGIYLPLLRAIENDPDLQLYLIVSGMHLSPEFGLTVKAIEDDGFEINERVEMLLSSDTPGGIAKSMGLGTIGFAQVYTRFRPDILVVLGDRFEMHAAVVAALPFKIPVAHVHGGESTEGLIDEQIRHSITKMSHLHFTSTKLYARRIVQMGEEPWRVVVSGALSLDNLQTMPRLNLQEIEERLGFDIKPPFLIVTYHPVTLEYEDTQWHIKELLRALDRLPFEIIFTSPNADTQGRLIIRMIRDFVHSRNNAHMVVNVGTEIYFSLMHYAAAMVGNSSSGIIEAASFKLPVVNIGNRQRGRLHGRNVIDVGYTESEILKGVSLATSSEFKESIVNMSNPYGDGHAAERILGKLKAVNVDERLLMKHFYSNEGATL